MNKNINLLLIVAAFTVAGCGSKKKQKPVVAPKETAIQQVVNKTASDKKEDYVIPA